MVKILLQHLAWEHKDTQASTNMLKTMVNWFVIVGYHVLYKRLPLLCKKRHKYRSNIIPAQHQHVGVVIDHFSLLISAFS